MRSINHFTSKDTDKNTLHIETEGATINIRVGLVSDSGNEVVNISVRPDSFAGEPRWFVVDENDNRLEFIGFRLVRETEEEYENRRAYDRIKYSPVYLMTLQDLFAKAPEDTEVIDLLTFKDRESEKYTLHITRMRGYKSNPDSYAVWAADRYRDNLLYTQFATVEEVIKSLMSHLYHWNGGLVELLVKE